MNGSGLTARIPKGMELKKEITGTLNDLDNSLINLTALCRILHKIQEVEQDDKTQIKILGYNISKDAGKEGQEIVLHIQVMEV